MSGENMSDIHAQLIEHRYEIETLKNSHGELISTLKETTKSMNELAKSFAVSAPTIEDLKKDVKELRDFKSAVGPFIEGLRGIVWKIIAGVAVASGSVQGLLMVLETASKTS